MVYLWLSVLLCSTSWLCGLNIYTDPIPWLGWVLVGAGSMLAFVGLRSRDYSGFDRKYLWLVLPFVFASAVLPGHYRVGPVLMVFALLLACPGRTRAIGFSALFVASVLLVQSLVPGIYGAVTARSPTANGVTPLVYGLLRFLRLPVSYSQNMLFIRTMRELYEAQTTWAALGLLPALLLLVGGVIVMTLYFRDAGKKLVLLVASMSVYAIARYVVMLLLFLYLMYFLGYEEETSKAYIFWNPVWITASFIPFLFLAKSLFRPADAPLPASFPGWPALGGRRKVSMILLCASAFLFTASAGFHEPGVQKEGRVLIDEGHSEWTVSTIPYDTKWYGAESGYNYYCMAEYIGHYFELARITDSITSQVLADCDVLILKIPTRSYAEDEIESVVEFVEGGGGLFLIGDHTNVFGSSTYLNAVAKRFGFKFRYDCLFDVERVFEQVYCRPGILPHPIIQRMPPFLFAVSCSIEPDSYLPGRVILAGGLKRLGIDYSVSNFYPQVVDRLGMWFGSFHQAVGRRYGRGRVLGFTDSTVYSNFSAFYPGKPEFLIASVDWLNRENRFGWVNRLLLCLAVLFLIVSAVLHRIGSARTPGTALLALAGVVSSISLAILLSGQLNLRSYRPRERIRQFTSVVFEQDHCDYDLPLTGFTREPARSYEIFFQWVLRLGYYPSAANSVKECAERGDVVVVINPNVGFSQGDLENLEEFVLEGGRLLVADSPDNDSEAAVELLDRFEITADKSRAVGASPVCEPISQSEWELGQGYRLSGGKPLLFNEEAIPVMTYKEHGKGLILALSFSQVFSDAGMGITEGVIPDEELLHHYRLQFAIMKGLVDGRPHEVLINAENL